MIKFIIIICSFIFSANIDAITQVYGDTSRVTTYHKNGAIKSEGIKVKKFKQGSWYYYDSKGFIVKVDYYKNGKKTKTYLAGGNDER